jgi:glycosyltransferase involved in cell wall biosynthesis
MRQVTGRIGIVMPLAQQQGGAELVLLHLLSQGSKRFDFFCVFLEEGPLVEQVRSLGYRTFVTQTTRLSDPENYIFTIFWLRRLFKREKPDAVLSWMPKAHLYVAPAAAMLRTKTLWFQHGMMHKSRINRVIMAFPANKVLCCSLASQASQDQLRPRRKTAVCYPGVRFPTAEPIPASQARAQLGFNKDAQIIGMVARMERWKGHHVFVEAARIVNAACPGTYFFIVGGVHPRDPAYAEEIREMSAKTGLADHFILAGQRPASEVPLWQASADLIVHPVTGQEPFGMAVAEAMGMGKVVVASSSGGPEEIIEDAVSGFLVPKGDAAKLAATVIWLLKNPEELRRIEPAAFLRGRSFSTERFAERVDDLLAETLA